METESLTWPGLKVHCREREGRRCKERVGFCQVHLLNNANVLNSTNCILCLVSNDSDMLFQIPEASGLRAELSKVTQLLEVLDFRISGHWYFSQNAGMFKGALGTPWKRLQVGYIIVQSNHIINDLKISLREIKLLRGQDGGSETKAGQGMGDDTDKNKILVFSNSVRWLRSLVSASQLYWSSFVGILFFPCMHTDSIIWIPLCPWSPPWKYWFFNVWVI